MENAGKKAFDAEHLLSLAKEARKYAYAPYSNFPVGASILFEDGSVVSGCNVENGSYSLSMCAERNAMMTAVSEGRLKPVAIAIVGIDGTPCPPCGACRQFLSEFNGDIAVILESGGEPLVFSLSYLLPMQFRLAGKGEK